jgi:hypothetical protein
VTAASADPEYCCPASTQILRIQISRTASKTSQNKECRLAFLSHTFLHATMMDLQCHPFFCRRAGEDDSRIWCSRRQYAVKRCSCSTSSVITVVVMMPWLAWVMQYGRAAGSWQRMSRAESRSNNRWGYCGDGVWRRGIGERRNPVSRNAKTRCDWLGGAR